MKYLYIATVALVACTKKDPPKLTDAAVVAKDDANVRAFDKDEDAFEEVLKSDPAVLAIGEAHAQRGATAASSTKRFQEELLPLLAGRASDLLVELMMPPKGCVKQTETMKSVQKPVTSQQAETNQNEYVALGEAARKLGIVPDLLRPSCDDLAAIADAGDDAIDRSLQTIARLTTAQAGKMLDRAGKKMVVTYGGALHNDAKPPPERAQWSYGIALSARVPDRYVELDLYVPDFITDADNWTKQPWYAAWKARQPTDKALLFTLAPRNYVLVLTQK
jgi:hypothetical protein